MKFLVDQNLPPRMALRLAERYPGSVHVITLGMDRSKDGSIWSHAMAHGFTIITRDGDFQQLSFLKGAPPKVVMLRIGNRSAKEIVALLEGSLETIDAFLVDPDNALLLISIG